MDAEPKKEGLELLSDEFCAAMALAALSRVKALAFAARIEENLQKYPDLDPDKRKAFERARDWLRMSYP